MVERDPIPTPQVYVGAIGIPGAPSVKVEGEVATGSPSVGKPVSTGGIATNNVDGGSPVDVGDSIELLLTRTGATIIAGAASTDDGVAGTGVLISDQTGSERPLSTYGYGLAPDGAGDLPRMASDSGPGKGALNVAPIGGDITLRASAVIGEASGASSDIGNIDWIKSFVATVDVTAAPSGGSPTLDVYIQTLLPSNQWQDIAHVAQITGVTQPRVAWGPTDGNFSGLGAEGAAVTYDRFFAASDAALAASVLRLMPMGSALRVKWVFAAGGSTGDFTFSAELNGHA